MTLRRRTILLGAGGLAVTGLAARAQAAWAAGGTTTVTVRVTSRDGQPAARGFVELIRTDEPAAPLGFPVAQGGGSVDVAPGEYLALVTIHDGRRRTLLVQPGLTVAGPLTLTCDARVGRPIEVTVPRADARPEGLLVHVRMPVHGEAPYETYFWTRDDHTDAVYIGAVQPERSVPGFQAMVAVTVAAADTAYFLAWQSYGRMPAGLRRVVEPQQLAAVVQHFGARAAGSTGVVSVLPMMPGASGGGLGAGLPVALPSTRVDHFNVDSGGVAWQTIFEERHPNHPDPFIAVLNDRFTSHRVPRRTVTRWHQGVPGPLLAPPEDPEQWVARNGDTLVVAVRMFSDAGGHVGNAIYRSARVTVHRDGVLVGEAASADGVFTLPPAPGTYRLAVAVEPAAYATRVDAVWTFRSGHVPGARWQRVPLRAVTFDPSLRPDGTAPGGRRVVVPYTMTTQAARVVRPSVSFSLDDGETWSPAGVTGQGVVVAHPPAAGWVSLRATAPGLRQTIIRAYRIAP